MNKNKIIKKVSGTCYKIGFKLKKHSPEIFMVAGVIGTVASAVMACRATTKVSTILDETKKEVNDIHGCLTDESKQDKMPCLKEVSRKELAIVYVQTGLKFTKLYAPSVMLGIASITSMITSNHILRKRNMALAAAYVTVDKGFRDYRKRVVERFGETVDRELRYNLKPESINGSNDAIVDISYLDTDNSYARVFDETCGAWKNDKNHNLFTIRAQQSYANDLLTSRGYLFLNEVYDMLGIQKIKAGQVIGWLYDSENPILNNYVDFGIQDYGDYILLDFNVDGDILSLMPPAI